MILRQLHPAFGSGRISLFFEHVASYPPGYSTVKEFTSIDEAYSAGQVGICEYESF